MAKSDKALEASMRSHRPRQAVADDVATTVFGQMGIESKEPIMIPIASILPSPFQSRTDTVTEEDEEYMENLMATIAEDSLLNPILVRVLESNTLNGRQTRVLESNTSKSANEGVLDSNTPSASYEKESITTVLDSNTVESGVSKVLESNTASADTRVLESNTPVYELIAGHNRLEAMRRLGRDKVPAVVRRMSDIEAARALTIDNLVRKGLTDWELYKHIAMLHSVNAVKSQKDLAKMLGCSRAKVMMLECFGKIPPSARDILNQQPGLLGASQLYDLDKAGYLESYPEEVAEAIERVADRKIKQSGILGYVQRKVDRPLIPYRKEVAIKDAHRTIKLVLTQDEAKVTGDIDFEKLHALIEQNLHSLRKE